MVKVYVGETMTGLGVHEIKGIRGGREWLAAEIEKCLAWRADMTIGLRWEELDVPVSLKKRLVVIQ